MPYFTRQPYAAPPTPATQAAAPDILALAAEVLAQETAAVPFRLCTPLRAGSAGRMILGFTAENAPVSTALTVTDLTGPAARIAAQNLRLDPPALHLAPGQSADVTVTVNAPQGLPPGLYRGLIGAPGSADFSAPIEVAITP
jgi:hypothetical protein